MLLSWSDRVVYFCQKPTLYPFSVPLSTVQSERIEAFLHVVQLMHKRPRFDRRAQFCSPQCSRTQKDSSVGAVARLGQREVSLFTGSVNKLNDFISVSHSTQKPYYTYSIYILFVHKITFTYYIHSFMHFFCFSFSFLSQFSSVIFISKSSSSLNAFACPFQKQYFQDSAYVKVLLFFC